MILNSNGLSEGSLPPNVTGPSRETGLILSCIRSRYKVLIIFEGKCFEQGLATYLGPFLVGMFVKSSIANLFIAPLCAVLHVVLAIKCRAL